MKLQIDWGDQIPLTSSANKQLIYDCALEQLPIAAGFYIFGRRHGDKNEALYVGRATSIQPRVKQQLKNLPLMRHLQLAKTGARFVIAGKFVPRPGQQQTKCLPIIERALIQHFLLLAHDLVNIQGVNLRRHEILSAGGLYELPVLMYANR